MNTSHRHPAGGEFSLKIGQNGVQDLPVQNGTFRTLINRVKEGNILHYTTDGRKTHRGSRVSPETLEADQTGIPATFRPVLCR